MVAVKVCGCWVLSPISHYEQTHLNFMYISVLLMDPSLSLAELKQNKCKNQTSKVGTRYESYLSLQMETFELYVHKWVTNGAFIVFSQS